MGFLLCFEVCQFLHEFLIDLLLSLMASCCSLTTLVKTATTSMGLIPLRSFVATNSGTSSAINPTWRSSSPALYLNVTGFSALKGAHRPRCAQFPDVVLVIPAGGIGPGSPCRNVGSIGHVQGIAGIYPEPYVAIIF